jgi:hypothetical protein
MDQNVIDRAREWVGEWHPELQDDEFEKKVLEVAEEIQELDDAQEALERG